MLLARVVADLELWRSPAWSPSRPPRRKPRPRESSTVTPAEARRPAEVSVAINPTNPDHVIAVLMQARRARRAARQQLRLPSFDGGLTWKRDRRAQPRRRVQGDDAVVFGRDGTAYHSYIAFDGIRVERPERAWSGIFVRSIARRPHVDDAGAPWSITSTPRSRSKTSRGWASIAARRRRIAATSTSPGRASTCTAATNPAHRSHIMFSRSRDGGRTFSAPLEISDETGDARDSDDTVEGAVPVGGPNGEVYIAWAGPKGLVFDKSDRRRLDVRQGRRSSSAMPGRLGPARARARASQRHAGDGRRPQRRARTRARSTSTGSTSGTATSMCSSPPRRTAARTWSAPVRVNDDPKGAAQMFTWLAVDPVDGALNLVFHDRRGQQRDDDGRDAGAQRRWRQDVREPPAAGAGVSTAATASAFFGDYNGIDAYGGRVVAAFPVLTAGDGQQKSAGGGRTIFAQVRRNCDDR